MGNASSSSHSLPQIWQRVNASHLRNRLTQEIIEQHSQTCTSEIHQLEVIASLKKRIGLHHPNIPRIIYFQSLEEQSICSQLQFGQRVAIYSEATGDTLEMIVEERGERLYHTPCHCSNILSATAYLKDHYGCFIVTPSMVYVGNRKQKFTKVWINSQVHLNDRESPASEEEMCRSIANLFTYMKSNRICSYLTDQYLQLILKIKRLSELKEFVFDAHRVKEEHTRHKKANSCTTQANNKQHYPNPNSNTETNRTIQITKQMPQRNEVEGANHLQKRQLKENAQNEYSIALLKSYHQQDSFQTPSLYVQKPELRANSHISEAAPKIKFIYHQPASKIPQTHSHSENTEPNPPTLQEESPNKNFRELINNKRTLFSPNIGISAVSQQVSSVNSPQNSPDPIKQQIDSENGRFRDLEIPLPEIEEKSSPTKLPTTSRSPKSHKHHQNLKQAAPQIIHNRYQPKTVNHVSKNSKNQSKTSELISSGNKFEKYKDAIKSYESKLRLKFANSVGSNPLSAQYKQNLIIKPIAQRQKSKEAKSIYNDSSEEKSKGYPSLEQIIGASLMQMNGLENTNQESRKVLPNKKIREKIEQDRELQRQESIIRPETQDVDKQQTMQEQYRSIREKIKQKNETFAQLKAEAIKILEDVSS